MVPNACTNEVIDLLTEIRRKVPQYNSNQENVFSAEQNAMVTVNAEKYYRAMLHGGAKTWNIRDTHMVDTLTRLLDFHGKHAKAIVWVPSFIAERYDAFLFLRKTKALHPLHIIPDG